MNTEMKSEIVKVEIEAKYRNRRSLGKDSSVKQAPRA